jgi:hypothetical protein
MMRNLIVLGCSALLAVALGLTSYAGTSPDTDSDGLADNVDNCDVIPNGPLSFVGLCNNQQDGDSDGFGNGCDTDTNNNGATDLTDVSNTLSQAKSGGTLLNYDFDCNGATSLGDVSVALADATAGAQPGPSCEHPLGTPCP